MQTGAFTNLNGASNGNLKMPSDPSAGQTNPNILQNPTQATYDASGNLSMGAPGWDSPQGQSQVVNPYAPPASSQQSVSDQYQIGGPYNQGQAAGQSPSDMQWTNGFAPTMPSASGQPTNQYSAGGTTVVGGNQAQPSGAPTNSTTGAPASANLFNLAGSNGGVPNYMGLAQYQQSANQQNAQQQQLMNNPDQIGPGGSRTMTMGPDGKYTVNTSLSPALQANYDSQNQLNGSLTNRAQQLAGAPALNYGSAGSAPTFNTSGVSGIPAVNDAAQKQAQDAAYAQQTQYLDPQFKQQASDLESKLANQGIMPGSEAYNREMLNFNNTKQQAYSNANMNAIQAGNAEQTNLFNMGNQAHTTGMNDALAGFNTGMQNRQQGVSEANALHNAPLNDLASLMGAPQMALPTYGGQVGTSLPGVDYLNAANMGYNANVGVQNANAASSANNTAGLFGLGSAFLQANPGILNGAGNYFSGLFGTGGGSNTDLSLA